MTNDIPRRKDGGIKWNFRPVNADELEACLKDPLWRVCSGVLYKIIIKGDDGQDGLVINFKPNRSQRRLLANLWHRNVILKARQLGFTTLICILWLDTALFSENMRCGIIAQDREAAEVIFRDKVKFAYENLPEHLKKGMPLARDSASELLFAHNNSSIRVATSMRSGTIHRLHISEFGKICAKYPDKAVEVVVAEIEKFTRLKEIQCENIVVSSFNWGVLKKIRFLDPKIQLGVLTEDNFENALDFPSHPLIPVHLLLQQVITPN